MKPIVVIGSLNMDLVVQTPKAPAAGETLAASSFHTIPGGKGANQAVAAARLACGAPVRMVGRVGQDAFGAQLSAGLAAEGIDTAEVRPLAGISSGVALIIVEASGENRILIVPGTNGQLTPADMDVLEEGIAGAGMLILQFEIPLPTVERAIQLANAHNVPVLLNPAPAYAVSPALLAGVDTLVLNEVESGLLAGMEVSDPASAMAAARKLLRGRTRCVAVTLGAKGAVAVTPEQALHVPAFAVKAVDTTAAGDSFIGALAVSLNQGKSLPESMVFAVAAGALAVTRVGAQSSIPNADEVAAFLAQNPISGAG